MKYNLYEVGGRVRDELLGIPSKDIDYSVVLGKNISGDLSAIFSAFEEQIKKEGYDVYLSTPECFTIRAKFPKGHVHEKITADFVLARKELYYKEGTREPVSVIGTLEDDLRRRDFTVNALAKDENGNIIDLFGGKDHLHSRILFTPVDPIISFRDDPLRIIRALRFCVTKGFCLSVPVINAISELGMSGIEVVSIERIREELYKCFKHNTAKTISYLHYFDEELNFPLVDYCFEGTGLWLEPTNKG